MPVTVNPEPVPSRVCPPAAPPRREEAVPPPTRGWRRFWAGMIAACSLLMAVTVLHEEILTGLAEAWVVDEPIVHADAIVVLGGLPEVRPFAAARLYHEGVAPRILYMDVKPGSAVELGVLPPERQLTRQILLANNVPETAMTAVGDGVENTYDESCAVRDWMKSAGARTIVIPTDLFHTRRVRWLFRRQLKALGATVCVRTVDPRRYNARDWWRHEEGVIAFQNEFIKSIYYRIKY
jgi:uncharacterized SAM-binding protein YcdF (DUF218 family)